MSEKPAPRESIMYPVTAEGATPIMSTIPSSISSTRPRDEALTHAEAGPAKRRRTMQNTIANRSNQRDHGFRGPEFADTLGELHPDSSGNLRYVGLGGTVSVIDICTAFRDRINRGLGSKGYKSCSNFSIPAAGAPRARWSFRRVDTAKEASSTTSSLHIRPRVDPWDDHSPPQTLVSVLVDLFYDKLYTIFPAICRADFERQLAVFQSRSNQSENCDFGSVLYSLLAFASPLLPTDHEIATGGDMPVVDLADLGAFLLDRARYCGQGVDLATTEGYYIPDSQPLRSLNHIIALTLRAGYLATTGRSAEAWLSIGQAVRLGLDSGLHRSGSKLGLPEKEQKRRQYLWWTMYSLDRTLSASLGRPLAIHDEDLDVELPPSVQFADDRDLDCAGFAALVSLRKILGDILTTIAPVRKVQASREAVNFREIKGPATKLYLDLQDWATSVVPESIKAAATNSSATIVKSVALSGYFSAIILLYRFFLGQPHHRPLRSNQEPLVQCARAATNCIRITEAFVTSVPPSPDFMLHIRNVYLSALILLDCIRRSDDRGFVDSALCDVEVALRFLEYAEPICPGTKGNRGVVEEYAEFTLEYMEKASRDHHECFFGDHQRPGERLDDQVVNRAGNGAEVAVPDRLNPQRETYSGTRFTSGLAAQYQESLRHCPDRDMVRQNIHLAPSLPKAHPTQRPEHTGMGSQNLTAVAPLSIFSTPIHSAPNHYIYEGGGGHNAATMPSELGTFYSGSRAMVGWGINTADGNFSSLWDGGSLQEFDECLAGLLRD
ncbi:fungal-specific transcription factor domain-containing protein [Xylariales sp. PMI_506]|nr:fungal-specific transcription factor domain-containing protein [Xylariales sp. PMI_506]